jgi:hypothetical protein
MLTLCVVDGESGGEALIEGYYSRGFIYTNKHLLARLPKKHYIDVLFRGMDRKGCQRLTIDPTDINIQHGRNDTIRIPFTSDRKFVEPTLGYKVVKNHKFLIDGVTANVLEILDA